MLSPRLVRERREAARLMPGMIPALLLVLPALGFAAHGETAAAIGKVAESKVVAQAWKGRMQEVEGILHLHNPAEPILEPLDIHLEPLWTTGTDPGDEIIGRIADVARDCEGNFYLLDSQMMNVRVHSPEGALLGVAGREGEGPGEFRRPQSALALPEGIVGVGDFFSAKIVRFQRDGTPAGEISLSGVNPNGGGRLMLQGVASVGSHLVAEIRHNYRTETSRITERSLVALTHQGRPLHTYVSRRDEQDLGLMRASDRDETFDRGGWALLDDGRVSVRLKRDAYEISIFSPGGLLERVIHREGVGAVRRSAEELEEMESSVQVRTHGRRRRRGPSVEYDFAPTDPIISSLWSGPGGQLWVRTCHNERDLPEGVLERIEIFDSQGRFLREARIHSNQPGEPAGIFYVGEHVVLFQEGVGFEEPGDEYMDADWESDADWEDLGEGDLDERLPTVTCYRMLLGPP